MSGGLIAPVDVLSAFHDEVKNFAVTTTIVINDLTGSDSNQTMHSVQVVRASLPVAWVTALAGDLSALLQTSISLCPSWRNFSWKNGSKKNKSWQFKKIKTLHYIFKNQVTKNLEHL